MERETGNVISERRKKGNEFYKAKHWESAIEQYSEGLSLTQDLGEEANEYDEEKVKLLLNRSQALGALEDWAGAERDAREALNVAHDNYKAYYLLGKALAKQGAFTEALTRLRRAESFASNKSDELFIQNLIIETNQTAWQEGTSRKVKQDHHLENILESDDPITLSQEEKWRLFELLGEEAARLRPAKIPQYLICPINNTLFRNPVILVPSGHSYEREAIELYIQSTQSKKEPLLDPITRQPVDFTVVPNTALKKAAADFMERNPWAAKEWLP
eukprot:Gregarina_sp_Poly_1__4717@NODE_251_length_10668_cov_46_370814_g33_i1_p4_GENE_NODE_251_length_10668_cov_46_370814_g33_i1NODE_251_length_10668_cov_46_370814_g33_i1_p4_ORF_typecomplete_len274_score49_56Ubox/PF04564_15/2_3e16TPR_16/PF13432_6/8_5TPR_16/PF13432_6/1_7e06TPR_MalT/PF17874_1/7_9e08zfNse/PF11789_8/4_1e03zfNse/PF11789_8/4_9e07zfNse/PF11789_8/5_9e02TPR_15/PF13429_6/1_7e07ANAPC3/PF12895_7/2_8e02ANAPC3/PF12895_7/2_3e05BTAD/PF03704_17/9_4e05TPR_2/PF07719_17/1_1TPR_2/PF07719_17/16TPR_2/PF07719_1